MDTRTGPLWSHVYGLVAAGYCWWRSADVVHARHLPGALLSTLTGRPELCETHLVPTRVIRRACQVVVALRGAALPDRRVVGGLIWPDVGSGSARSRPKV